MDTLLQTLARFDFTSLVMALFECAMFLLIGNEILKAETGDEEAVAGNTRGIIWLGLLIVCHQTRRMWDLPEIYDIGIFVYLLRMFSYHMFLKHYVRCSTRMTWYYTSVFMLIHAVCTGLRRVPVLEILYAYLEKYIFDPLILSLVYNGLFKNLIYLIVVFVFLDQFPFRSVQKYSITNHHTLLLCLVFQIIVNETAYFYLIPSSNNNLQLQVVLSLYITAIELFLFLFFLISTRGYSQIKENEILSIEAISNQYVLHTLNDYIISEKKFRALRHDMKNHLLVLQQMAEKNEAQKANLYIKKLINDFIALTGQRFRTGHVMLDGLVSMKYRLMQERQIEFSCSMFIGHDLSPVVTDADMCIIFGNLLDNAIDATEKLESGRYIRLRSHRQGSYLCVTLSNSYNGHILKSDDRLLTTKKNDGHGYGLNNVRSAVERIGGILTVNHSDPNEFWAIVLFPLSDEEPDDPAFQEVQS